MQLPLMTAPRGANPRIYDFGVDSGDWAVMMPRRLNLGVAVRRFAASRVILTRSRPFSRSTVTQSSVSSPPTKKTRNTLKVARKAVRDIRREQLIEAAIRAISKHGIGETTIAHVVQEAGMANGAVNQYFASKDMLLLEALRAVTGEFRDIWHQARARAGADPAAILEAVVMAQLHPKVCRHERISVWVAYWSEVRFRPKYMDVCTESDAEYGDALMVACRAVAKDGRYKSLDADKAGQFLLAAGDGLWVSIMLGLLTRDEAAALMRAHLASVFPKHFID
jgi:TetR/AcrR family transcriptional regulator, transcriptional repressor of bet genes